MIIDCHVHLNHYADEEFDGLSTSLSKLLATMRRNRVDQSIILTSYKVSPGRPSMRQVVEAVKDTPSLHVVAGISYETVDAAVVEDLDDLLAAGLLKGLKLYPGYEPFYPCDPKLEPVYDLAAKYDVPVMIHCGDTYSPRGKVKYSHPLNVDEVAVDHPDVKFVICHLGNPWLTDCMEVVYKNANVYADISGLVLGDFTDRFEAYMRRQLQDLLVWGVDPSNVLYGTDWPISSMESYLEFMEDLKIPVKEREAIMWENTANLFKLPRFSETSTLGSLFAKR
ncbi:MAG: amidohydrolase family protein [Gemmatimonadetes bacterium]|nr:amidohydrolase family protein [Gemmatimonadota bacterium]